MHARSLYIHFPFCEKKCHYCDFYSLGGAHETLATAFETAMETEAWLQAPLLDHRIETIFFGGGTPTLTDPQDISRFLTPLWANSRLDPNLEWTTEANPSSLTPNRLFDLKNLGVNRLSIGVQSLAPRLLSLLGRVHSREQALRALTQSFEAGFDNISVDLLCGVPEQTLTDLEDSLETITRFPIKHLSCYLLTLTEDNSLFERLPDEDTQLEHLLFVDQWMEGHGFEHYEISNFAKPGHRCQHNLNYWKGESYLGLGPSAHSFDSLENKRWKNLSPLEAYLSTVSKNQTPIEWSETLTPAQLELERWMLALRMSDGFPASWLDTPARQRAANELQRTGLLMPHSSISENLRLTPKGFALSDEVIRQLI